MFLPQKTVFVRKKVVTLAGKGKFIESLWDVFGCFHPTIVSAGCVFFCGIAQLSGFLSLYDNRVFLCLNGYRKFFK